MINKRKSWRFGQEEQGARVLGEYECVGEENEDGESEGVATRKFEVEKEENVGLFVKFELESYWWNFIKLPFVWPSFGHQ